MRYWELAAVFSDRSMLQMWIFDVAIVCYRNHSCEPQTRWALGTPLGKRPSSWHCNAFWAFFACVGGESQLVPKRREEI
jgi:hypothetical protein